MKTPIKLVSLGLACGAIAGVLWIYYFQSGVPCNVSYQIVNSQFEPLPQEYRTEGQAESAMYQMALQRELPKGQYFTVLHIADPVPCH